MTTLPTARIIDGAALAAQYRLALGDRVRAVRERGGRVRLDAVLVEAGDNSARVYAENQARTCGELGIEYRLHRITPDDETTAYDEIAGRVLLLSSDESVSAVMLHLPLPHGVDAYRVQRLIAPEKDVEGVNPANIGNIVYGRSSLAPCTALAVLKMLEWVWHTRRAEGDAVAGGGVPFLRGQRAVVVGAGDVVGKPIAVLLMRQEATVVSCNKWTAGLEDLTRSADIVIAAAGVPGLVTPEMVKPGAVVVDVGVTRVKGEDGKSRTVGDVAFAQTARVAGWISPVPGGVGPMTVAMLLHNVVEAAERRLGA